MFDNRLRLHIDPVLNKIGDQLARSGVTPNAVTWSGFALGLAAALAIVAGHFWLGLGFILLSRLCDGLDGAVARSSHGKVHKSDLGGFLDIALDFGFYGIIPLAFIVHDPVQNGLAGAVLLFTFYFNGASFLAFAVMAEKAGVNEQDRGSKSLLYTIGIAEASETLAVFVLFCLFPGWFSPIAYLFSAVVLMTTAARIALAYRTFSVQASD